ncbi:MAG: heavy-metal-associated domain-containing protein [Burkholderiales bacterium]|nr:heavy-metal-associated domain-containing protein [Burkholderiales bacterium]NCW86869.1 copper chaperone [Oxalobacteraceae bacterium]
MYELKVDGMTCGGCVSSVKRALQALDANASIDVDLQSKTVKIDTAVELHAVKAAVEDAGYDVLSAT